MFNSSEGYALLNLPPNLCVFSENLTVMTSNLWPDLMTLCLFFQSALLQVNMCITSSFYIVWLLKKFVILSFNNGDILLYKFIAFAKNYHSNIPKIHRR